MPFQTQVNAQPAIGLAGDFASANPRAVALSTAGFLVANGPVTVGNFAWSTGGEVSSSGTGPVTGFVHREQQALITTYLAEASLQIPSGFPVTLHVAGDFLAKNAGSSVVTVGLKAFASLTDGSVSFAAAGATVAGSVETKWIAMTSAGVGELVKISTHVLG
jgi:hypothetical protein